MSLTRTQLPVRLTPLVGRERELDDIAEALRRTRLITLTGPGGTGKTRLALAAAQAAEASFPAGARWVSLAQIEDPAIAGQAVATQLGVPDTPGQDPVEAIAKHLAGQRVLVVLDNCEHLAEAVAGLAEYLLAACPALVVLATSREALGVEGELSWQVPSLSLPPGRPSRPPPGPCRHVRPRDRGTRRPPRRWPPPTRSGCSSSGPSWCGRPSGSRTRTPRRCWPSAGGSTACRWRSSWPRRGCGSCPRSSWPSGWTTSSPSWSAARARRHPGTRRCAPPSTGATTCSTRTSGRCSGGWPPSPAVSRCTAAERIAATGDIRPNAMLELLTRLADKSLLRVEHDRSGTRYSLLATIRDYARDRLAEAGERDQVRRAHLAVLHRARAGRRCAHRPGRRNSTGWTPSCRTCGGRSTSPRRPATRWRRCGSPARWTATPTCAAGITRSGSGWTRP